MKPSEVKRCLWRELDALLSEHGFKRRSCGLAGDLYLRAVSGGSQQISFPTYARGGRVEVYYPFVGLHLDAVEDFVAQFEAPSPVPVKPSDIEIRSTIGFRAEKTGITAILEKIWTLCDEAEAIKVAKELVTWVLPKANPFWERFSDAREVLRLLCGNSDESRRLGGLDHFRAEKAVALAMQLDGKESARRLASEKLSVLRGDQQTEFKDWIERALS